MGLAGEGCATNRYFIPVDSASMLQDANGSIPVEIDYLGWVTKESRLGDESGLRPGADEVLQ